ncbi:MAG: hypothetical protein M1113_05585 [Candidatus Thermoplasmatota archaeon]|nr:hypothetical protein [Candidatus Thermoplasmatota archaeon]
MFSKIKALIVVLAVATAGTGLAVAYHNGLFSSNDGPQTLLPGNLSSSNNSSSSQSNNTTSTTNNHIQDNVIVNQVQAYFTISDSQGVNVNFWERFPGFKMMASNSTQVNISITNNNFFNITLDRINIQSDGFDLENVDPLLPTSLTSYSSKNLTLQIFTQSGMKNFNGSIQVNIFGNRTTEVSVSNISVEDATINNINNSKSMQMVVLSGFSSISGEVVTYNFTIHDNHTYAINVTNILINTAGFSICSTDPRLPVIIMPNGSKTISLNISISKTRAGYNYGLKMITNLTSSIKVDITTIKPYLQSIDFYGIPSISGTIGSNAVAGGNFTIQIALSEYYGDYAEISGFESSTIGFTVLSAYPFGGTLPICMTNEEIWFIINIHVSNYMAGYAGTLSIGINDSQC